jgi:5'-3' exonuclease
MKLPILYILTFAFFAFSCQDNSEKRLADQKKEAQKKEIIFANISKGWVFTNPQTSPIAQAKINNWMEWRAFVTEINQKPQSSIGAFQKKATILSKKVIELNNNIPLEFNKPQIRSRITVLTTKIKALDLFIHLQQIPDKKVIQFINDSNIEITSLTLQFEEIVRRSQIQREEGEPDFIKMKDTTRAIPTPRGVVNQ